MFDATGINHAQGGPQQGGRGGGVPRIELGRLWPRGAHKCPEISSLLGKSFPETSI